MKSRLLVGLCCAASLWACEGETPGTQTKPPEDGGSNQPTSTPNAAARVPVALESCAGCHAGIVRAFLGEHAMAASVGPVGEPPTGSVVNPGNGRSYEISRELDGAWLTTLEADGGRRRQRLVGRIGAGRFGNSWVTVEADVVSGELTDRLFFAPLETMGGELVLAPFEEEEPAAGADMALTEGCLGCHVDQALSELPGAAVGEPLAGGTLFPANALGRGAFEHLSGLGCATCHGSADYHLAVIAGTETALDHGLPTLGALPAAVQLDTCARCHLQGEARWELHGARARGPSLAAPLAARLPVLVTATNGDDFRFVGQLERLSLSACFQQTKGMTCASCHDPHRGVAAQGVTSFDASCQECHRERGCTRPADLAVEAVTGEPPRTADGCVDCHVRRSQPFDLTHVRSADHWVRRRIPIPETGISHRQFSDREAPLRLWDRERIAEALDTAAGRRWENAVVGMGLATMGRVEEAAARFAALPAPGTAEAVTSAPQAPLSPVLERPDLHQSRGLVLLATGDLDGALAAFGDALALDPTHPAARLARARIRLDRGDVAGSLEDTQVVIEAFPTAEHPWRLRVDLAERAGRVDMALAGLEALTRRWPSDGVSWQKLGLLLQQRGDRERAADALTRAELLAPDLDLRRASGGVGR